MSKLDFYDRGPDRPWVNRPLTNAAIVGHTTTDGARLWVRVWEPGKYWLLLSDTEIMVEGVPVAGGAGKAVLPLGDGSSLELPGLLLSKEFDYSTDLTGVFELTGLQPGTEYYYCVFFDGERKDRWELRPDPERRKFRTRPEAPARVTFGLFSCHMPYKSNGDLVNIQMWDRLAEGLETHDADFVVGAGDQVYTDGNKGVSIWRWLKRVKGELLKESEDEQHRVMRSWYRDIYRGYWGFRPVQRVFGRFPTYMVWDDHEIMDGWGSYTEKELADQLDTIWEWESTEQNLKLAGRMFDAARATYEEYQHCHNPPTEPGTYDYHFAWGPCAFYVLDMRGHRDYNRPTEDKILGPEQMERFRQWLDSDEAAKAKALFIVSTVPVVHISNFIVNTLDLPLIGLADDLRDEWAHESHWAERNRLLDAVFKYSQEKKRRVVFLSGDVHIGAGFRLSRAEQPAARVYQLTSSGITYTIPALLKLAVRGAGNLGDADSIPPEKRTVFQTLHAPFARNNFGMISVRQRGDGDVDIGWSLYGGTGEEDEVVRLKEVRLG
jgi:alkaline phosphatase D